MVSCLLQVVVIKPWESFFIMFKNKFYSYVGGSNADLSFSVESYYEISEVLIDQYLSKEVNLSLYM